MTVATIFDATAAILLLAVAVYVIAARNAFAATIGFVAYGLLLAICWMRLAAVDVALTEAAIGGGVTGMLLIGAAARLSSVKTPDPPIARSLRLMTALLCVLISVGIAAVFASRPQTIFTLAPAAVAHLPDSGLGNAVAGVLFVYRAFDTLLEKVVLLLALVGVWSLAPDRFWGGVPGLRLYAQPNSILAYLAQILPPLGIVIGIYLSWTGANEPGGAFQGGAVLAAMWILVMIAGLQKVLAINSGTIRLAVIIGPVIFLAIGLAGVVVANAFLAYPLGYAKPLIILIEAALTLSIGTTLGLLAAGPPQRIR